MLRRAFGWCAIALLVLGGASVAEAQAHKKYKGQIIVSDQPIPADGTEDELAKLNRTTLEKGDSSGWAFYFLAFLNKKAGTEELSFVFYDAAKKERKPVEIRDIRVDASSTILLSSLEVEADEDGLKAGTTYDVVIGRMVDGKETVYAKTKLTLK